MNTPNEIYTVAPTYQARTFTVTTDGILIDAVEFRLTAEELRDLASSFVRFDQHFGLLRRENGDWLRVAPTKTWDYMQIQMKVNGRIIGIVLDGDDANDAGNAIDEAFKL